MDRHGSGIREGVFGERNVVGATELSLAGNRLDCGRRRATDAGGRSHGGSAPGMLI